MLRALVVERGVAVLRGVAAAHAPAAHADSEMHPLVADSQAVFTPDGRRGDLPLHGTDLCATRSGLAYGQVILLKEPLRGHDMGQRIRAMAAHSLPSRLASNSARIASTS